jgi:hypothetical protein
MTVCIAMAANSGKELVLVSDSKVAFRDFSADDAVVKNIPFVWPWTILFAGDDISYATSILDRAHARGKESHDQSKKDISSTEMAEILQEEMEVELSRIIESSILSRYGFTVDTFRDNGKALCSESLYNDIIYKIADARLSLSFLLCGIPEKGEAEIWMITPDSPPENYERISFWAIGSGAQAAISSLAHSIQFHLASKYHPRSVVLYNVLAAKFMAETARDVGKGTFVVVIERGNKVKFLKPLEIKKVRDMWEKEGAPRIPKGVTQFIEESLYSPKKKRKTKKKSDPNDGETK